VTTKCLNACPGGGGE